MYRQRQPPARRRSGPAGATGRLALSEPRPGPQMRTRACSGWAISPNPFQYC